MLLYYITDRRQFPGNESARRIALLEKVAEAADAAVDFIQLREKDLSTLTLLEIAKDAMRLIHATLGPTRLLINSRTDVAIAAEAGGVHLPSMDISAAEVRGIWNRGAHRSSVAPVVTVACHHLNEPMLAAEGDADFALFGAVFGKQDQSPAGLDRLREVSRRQIPIIALGGITTENAKSCLDAGAIGVAGIRLFQEHEICSVVAKLK